jgi:2,2-dialkylglycine decarboxylase (pyruvate)
MSMSDKRTDFLIRYAPDFAPFLVARASRSWLETTEGQRILDFTSGQICSTIGHNHPQLVTAVKRSLEEVIHLNSWMLSEPVLVFAERLVELVGEPLEKVILVNTGARQMRSLCAWPKCLRDGLRLWV